jgi:signal transduction histidine kinase
VSVLREAVTAHEVQAKERDVELRLDLTRKRVGAFVFDRAKVHIALQNLLDNALKYTPAGGSVSVKLDVNDEDVHITVADTGIGMSPEEQKNLFTKFFRSTPALHMYTNGTGLGLYITKNIIERHGGTISVVSGVGKGTSFTVSLPRDSERIPKGIDGR